MANAADAVGRVAPQWPGWSVAWPRDRYEFQWERTRGLLRFPETPVATRAERLRKTPLYERERSPADALRELAGGQREQGKEVRVTPLAVRDDPRHVPYQEKERIVEVAFATLHRSRAEGRCRTYLKKVYASKAIDDKVCPQKEPLHTHRKTLGRGS